jgi:hypothetical protein
VVTAAVTFLWNFFFYARATADWEMAFRLAIIFGIVLPLVKARENLIGRK